jgi:N-acetylmuramic acid 6-phosphate etherase
MRAGECDRATAEAAFLKSGKRPKIAILMVLLGIGDEEAERLVDRYDGHLSMAVQAFKDGGEGADAL